MSATSGLVTARLDETSIAASGSSVDVDLQGGFIADDRDQITDLLGRRMNWRELRAVAGNDEVRQYWKRLSSCSGWVIWAAE